MNAKIGWCESLADPAGAVADPDTSERGGQETWNISRRTWRPSFLAYFLQAGGGGHGPLGPPPWIRYWGVGAGGLRECGMFLTPSKVSGSSSGSRNFGEWGARKKWNISCRAWRPYFYDYFLLAGGACPPCPPPSLGSATGKKSLSLCLHASVCMYVSEMLFQNIRSRLFVYNHSLLS